MTEESAAAIRAQLGLDDPLLVQYGRFLSGLLLEFDLGRSWYTHQPVLDDLLEAFPYTIALTLAGALVAILIGVPLGIVAAVNQGTWRDEAGEDLHAGRRFATQFRTGAARDHHFRVVAAPLFPSTAPVRRRTSCSQASASGLSSLPWSGE